MNCYGMTDVGMCRSDNQDFFKTAKAPDGMLLAVVCDGMGGAAGGSTASRMAAEEFCRYAADTLYEKFRRREELTEEQIRDILERAVHRANLKVYTASVSDRRLHGMGTTLTGALLREDWFWVVSVGDSRAYQFRGRRGRLITHDHSYVQMLLDAGHITEEEATVHPQKNIITRALGTASIVDVDMCEFDLESEDLVLLCTDGFWEYIQENEMVKVLKGCKTPQQWIGKMLKIIHKRAKRDNDNLSAVAIFVK